MAVGSGQPGDCTQAAPSRRCARGRSSRRSRSHRSPFGRDVDAALRRIASTVRAARAAGARFDRVPRVGPGRLPAGDRARDAARARHAPAGAGPRRSRDRTPVADRRRRGPLRGLQRGRPGGERRASAVCVSGDGVLGRHRKVHLPPAERFAYAPGDGFAAFDTPVGRIGMLLCYDKLFPEASRAAGARRRGGHRVHVGRGRRTAAGRAPDLRDDRQTRHFDAVDCVRAIENQVVWVSSNLTGPWGARRFVGRAKVVIRRRGARGDGADEGVALARVDPGTAIAEALLDIDHLGDRRPAAYGEPRPAFARAGRPAPRAASSSDVEHQRGARVVDGRDPARAHAVRRRAPRRPRAAPRPGRVWATSSGAPAATQARSRYQSPASCERLVERLRSCARRSARLALLGDLALARLRSFAGSELELVGAAPPRPAPARGVAARAGLLEQPGPRAATRGASGERRARERLGAGAQRRAVAQRERAARARRRRARGARRRARCSGATPVAAAGARASSLGAGRVEAHGLAARGDRRQHLGRAGR